MVEIENVYGISAEIRCSPPTDCSDVKATRYKDGEGKAWKGKAWRSKLAVCLTCRMRSSELVPGTVGVWSSSAWLIGSTSDKTG